MNYDSMSHQQTSGLSRELQYPQYYFSLPDAPNTCNSATNRFIYVKHNFINPNPTPTPKVLINPHFKKKVFINPQFHPPQNILPAIKPKIHVNPNVLKNFRKDVPKVATTSANETKPVTVISTRNKLVRIPSDSTNVAVRSRKRRESLHTKYKIVRSEGVTSPFNRFKLDKRDKSITKPITKSAKKKYLYVNRFLSMDVMAKSVLLKKKANLCRPGFVNINGILYKKSPNSLKKASESLNKPKVLASPKLQSSFKRNLSLIRKKSLNSTIQSSKYKFVKKSTKEANLSSSNARRSLVRRYKLIRSKKSLIVKPSPSKLHKCNIPCPIFRKYGKCPRKTAGTCFKLHNPDQIVLCTRFLQGACHNENCLLSHKVSHEKMPTCKFFLDGLCSKDSCPYLHVKISPKADICRDFLEGFCKKGAQCDKRHQFLCPEFEKNRRCVKRKCPYPHGNMVRKNSKVLNTLAKKCSPQNQKKKKIVKNPIVETVSEKNRYYKDLAKDSVTKIETIGEPVLKTFVMDRPKLGELPSFIPFFEGS